MIDTFDGTKRRFLRHAQDTESNRSAVSTQSKVEWVDKLYLDLKTAMQGRDEIRVSTLRLLLAEIKNKQIAQQADLKGEEIVQVIRHEVKNRQESIEAYQKGGRQDLVDKEQKELSILNTYLPQQMADDELEKIVREIVSESGAVNLRDFGKVMGAVMGKVKGQVDGERVSAVVKQILDK